MNMRFLKLRSSVFQGQGLRAVKIVHAFVLASTWKDEVVMFSPSQSNTQVLSCTQGDSLQINYCEIINILKNNEVKVVL